MFGFGMFIWIVILGVIVWAVMRGDEPQLPEHRNGSSFQPVGQGDP